MWTLQYYEDGVLKAKEFPTREEALHTGMRKQLRGEWTMDQLINPDKDVELSKTALLEFYTKGYDNL